MHLSLLFQIDPQQALHDAWHASSPEVNVTTVAVGAGATGAGVPWAAIATFVSIGVPLLFGVLCGCYQQMRVTAIKINEAQRLSDARVDAARKSIAESFVASTLPGRVLVPDARAGA